MSSRVDLEAAYTALNGRAWAVRKSEESGWVVRDEDVDHICTLIRDVPALRDEIKRLRLELAAKKQHVRACHAVAHGTIGKADDALREAARLEVEAKRTTEGV